jgi:hypothetical protein
MKNKDDNGDKFDAFVRSQQPAPQDTAPIDWAKERDEWLQYLDELYRTTESFLKKYIESGEIKCEYREIQLNEEDIGSYTARQMIIRIGRQEVVLKPVGTLLIGSKGRVDVVGPAGRTRFLLVDSESSGPNIRISVYIPGRPPPLVPEPPKREIKWAWKIATSPPTVRYIDLTKESLFQALLEVVNG